MRISSIHCVLEGEGVNSGIPSVLVRFSGCPVKCRWCDATDALDFKSGREMSVDEVYQEVRQRMDSIRADWVMVTGGEPLYQAEAFQELVMRLYPFKIEVCTSGVLPPPREDVLQAVRLWVVDYKCPSSGAGSRAMPLWISRLHSYKMTPKFVVRDETDLEFALQHKVSGFTNILSPVTWDIKEVEGEIKVGREQTKWNKRVADFAMRFGFRFSTQAHVYLHGMGRQDV